VTKAESCRPLSDWGGCLGLPGNSASIIDRGGPSRRAPDAGGGSRPRRGTDPARAQRRPCGSGFGRRCGVAGGAGRAAAKGRPEACRSPIRDDVHSPKRAFPWTGRVPDAVGSGPKHRGPVPETGAGPYGAKVFRQGHPRLARFRRTRTLSRP
jgi:hypothetical protein